MPRTALPRFAAAVVLLLAPMSARAQAPESHTVKPGDTLWDLAKQYLGDPFLWPEIYRLNTLVVEDPHWIYPGEVLRLAPSEKATAVPEAEAPAPVAGAAPPAPAPPAEERRGLAEVPPTEVEPPAEAQAPGETELPDTTPLFPASRGRVNLEALTGGELPPPKPVRRGEFYSSGFLTEDDQLAFGRVIGPTTPLQIPTRWPTQATLYTRIAIEPPAGGKYEVGDSLLLATVQGPISGYGRVIVPSGLARVVEISEGTPIAEVLAVFSEVRRNQAVLPAEKFADPGTVRPVAVSDGVRATVIGWPGVRELKGTGVALFLDKGKRDGVALGDVFELRRNPGRQSDGSVTTAEPMARLQVVHVRGRTATTRVMTVLSPDIPRGTHAFQVAKLPS